MPFWALLPCLLRPFCGEGMADHVWKGQVWSWRCYCFKGEKTKVWENEEPLFNAQTSFSILLKSLSLNSILVVLSSKSPTSQAQYLMFYLLKVQHSKPKRLMFYLPKVQLSKLNACGFIFQKTNFPSPNACGFIFQKTNVPSSNAWCFIFQKLNIPSSNTWCFISQKSNVSSLRV